jgi:hypothetical protein
MYRHHGAGSRRITTPDEIRTTLPPLWAAPWLGSQPTGDPAPSPGTTPPAEPATAYTQAQLDALIEQRLQRDRATRPGAPADLDTLRDKAAKYDVLSGTVETDMSRAVAEARTAAQAEAATAARDTYVPRLLSAEVRAARPDLTAEQVGALLAPLAVSYFVGPDGQLDPAKVTAYVGTIPGGIAAPVPVPAVPDAPPAVPALPPLGQGSSTVPPVSAAATGRARAHSQFGTALGPGRPANPTQ